MTSSIEMSAGAFGPLALLSSQIKHPVKHIKAFLVLGDGSNVDVINLRGIIRSAFLSLPWGIEAFHSDACDYFNAVRAAYTDQRRHKRAILYQDIDYPEEQANFIHHDEH